MNTTGTPGIRSPDASSETTIVVVRMTSGRRSRYFSAGNRGCHWGTDARCRIQCRHPGISYFIPHRLFYHDVGRHVAGSRKTISTRLVLAAEAVSVARSAAASPGSPTIASWKSVSSQVQAWRLAICLLLASPDAEPQKQCGNAEGKLKDRVRHIAFALSLGDSRLLASLALTWSLLRARAGPAHLRPAHGTPGSHSGIVSALSCRFSLSLFVGSSLSP